MRQKKVWRYYCEFCKKSGCSKWHLQKHERGCTLNPDRACGMCKIAEEPQRPLAELLAVFDGYVQHATSEYSEADLVARVKRLEDLTEGCPACMLATARGLDKRENGVSIDVNFKNRCEAFWECHREDSRGCY